MSIIDDRMARSIAKEEAKIQIGCNHNFQTRHIELLNTNVEICVKCDINRQTYLYMRSVFCFGQHHWYRLKCWQCSFEMLCQVSKEAKK
jgi:hypothetical protein